MELCFDPKLKPYLLQLKEKFTKYQLENAIQLKSFYAIRLYELLKQYEGIGKRSIRLDNLRNIMGTKSEQYPLYGNFKQKILKIAKKEINKKTDITFDFEEKKEGRKVSELVFRIWSKDKTKKPNDIKEKLAPASYQTDMKSLLEMIPDEHRENKKIRRLISEYLRKSGAEYVRYHIEYTNNQIKDRKKYCIYLEKALENNWGEGYAEERNQKEQQKARLAEIAAQKILIKEQEIIFEKFKELKEKRFWEKFDLLSEKEKERLTAIFIEKIAGNIFLTRYYNEGGVRCSGVRGVFQMHTEHLLLTEEERSFQRFSDAGNKLPEMQ